MAPFPRATRTGDDLQGWVSEPSGRGTLGIIVPCMAVIFLNTWTILHLNIPSPYDGRCRRLFHRVKCWIIAVFVPDAVVTLSFEQWRRAQHTGCQMKPHYDWWTMKHGFYAEMGGWRVHDKSTGQVYTFKGKQLAWLVKKKLIKIPDLPAADLDDRSDADSIAKGIAVIQALWFLVSFLARVVDGLPFTTLELEVLPFIFMTWFTYWFWWHKPFNVLTFTKIEVECLTPDSLCQLATATCNPEEKPYWWRPVPKEVHKRGWDFYCFERPLDMSSIRSIFHLHAVSYSDKVVGPLRQEVGHTLAEPKVIDWYRPSVDEMRPSAWTWVDDLVIFIAGIFVNGILLGAWNFQFPSHIEAWMWKITVLTMIGVICIWLPVAWVMNWLLSETSMRKHIPFYIMTLSYGFARAYIIFEPVVGLRRLPAGCFQTVNWSKYFPYMGAGN